MQALHRIANLCFLIFFYNLEYNTGVFGPSWVPRHGGPLNISSMYPVFESKILKAKILTQLTRKINPKIT